MKNQKPWTKIAKSELKPKNETNISGTPSTKTAGKIIIGLYIAFNFFFTLYIVLSSLILQICRVFGFHYLNETIFLANERLDSNPFWSILIA